jgi:hypothetical protein
LCACAIRAAASGAVYSSSIPAVLFATRSAKAYESISVHATAWPCGWLSARRIEGGASSGPPSRPNRFRFESPAGCAQ